MHTITLARLRSGGIRTNGLLLLSQNKSEPGHLRRGLHQASPPPLAKAHRSRSAYSPPQGALESCEVVVMTQQYASSFHQHHEFTLQPVYRCDTERTIGILQQLQRLCLSQGDVSLSDVIEVLQDMQREFGTSSSLEQVIQSLIGQRLREQQARRRSTRSTGEYVQAEEVLA